MSTETSSHLLRLNDLILSSGDGPALSDDGTWWLDVYGSDFTTGASEPVEVTMRTLLQDGARVVTTGYGNREVSFYVVVGANDSVALADAELALALLLGRRAELGWTPPDGWAPESVFDVETSSMEPGGPEDDDLVEVTRNERVYRLRFVCLPSVRTPEQIVVPAVTVPVEALDEDVLDAGTATTRWSARIGTVTDAGVYLQGGSSRTPRMVFTPAAPVDISTQPYLTLATSVAAVPNCSVNGVRAELVGSSGQVVGPNFGTRYYWRTEETTLTTAEFGVDLATATPFLFKDLRARNLPSYAATLRQSQRTIEIAGSVRTQGSLQIVAPEGESLGDVVFYSSSAGTGAPIPSLRALRVSGATQTPNADMVSGFNEPLTTSGGTKFDIPVASLTPGKHQILARIRGLSADAVLDWTAQARIGSTDVGPAITGACTVLGGVSYPLWIPQVVATIDLPTIDLPTTSSAVIRLSVEGDASYDEMWVLNLDHGAVTIVAAGTHERVWIETATTERPRPAIYVGDAEDQSDAFHDPALVGAWGVHDFSPPLTAALVVTGDCDGPDVSFTYYDRYMNFVAARR